MPAFLRRLEANAAAALLVMIAALSFAQVVARVASRSFSYTEEITRLLLAWVCMLGAAEAARAGGHLGMRLLSVLRPQSRGVLRVVELSALAVFFLALGVVGGILVLKVQAMQTTEALGWPKWPFGLAIPVGCALGLARCVQRIISGNESEPSLIETSGD
ncbi:MAG TPA: TRAP transporter small permease [Candidatus Brocadiia bacterium]|nr:TRAP transporter small permease [Candidatus Brocadiia bacterium]